MKISKLFHWLYGAVMLLPLFAIGTTCLISTFNMSAKEESEVIYKYETNEVNSADDLIQGHIYHFSADISVIPNYRYFLFGTSIYNMKNNNYEMSIDDGIKYFGILKSDAYKLRFQLRPDNTTITDLNYNDVNTFECDVVYYPFESSSLEYFDYTYFTSTDFNVFERVETHNLDTQEVFYRSIDKVMSSDVFSWSYDSFLVAPFTYIVTLFSMPTDSVIVELLSYWLAISIIWLVFDLVMYVPLLVHRWIDKGVLE